MIYMKFLIKAYAEGWVTINGNHVYIGAEGTITKGPASMKGLKVGKSGKVNPNSVAKEIEGKLKKSKSTTLTQKGDWGRSSTKVTRLKNGEYSVSSTVRWANRSIPSADRQIFSRASSAAKYATKFMSETDPYKISGK